MSKDARWFWRKVIKCACVSESIIPVDEESCSEHCWPWVGSTNEQGYGRTRTIVYGKQEVYAHRVAWALAYQRACVVKVCHSCDHPPCCNPTHLWAGTQQHNVVDAIRKKRYRQLYRRPRKLTDRKVRHIKRLIALGTLTFTQIAKRYHVSQPLISQIHAGWAWKHLAQGS